jgi:hypothetical protein
MFARREDPGVCECVCGKKIMPKREMLSANET